MLLIVILLLMERITFCAAAGVPTGAVPRLIGELCEASVTAGVCAIRGEIAEARSMTPTTAKQMFLERL
jgi:hypothetical protein